MITPRFNLKDKRANKTLIFLVLEKDKKRLRLSTSLSVIPRYWNDKTQSVRENREFEDGEKINKKLKAIKNAIEDAEEYYDNIGISPSVYLIKEKYQEFLDSPKKQASTNQFWEHFEEFLEDMKNNVNKKTGKKVSKRTVGDYDKGLRKHIVKTEKLSKIAVSFNSLKQKGGFHNKMEHYLRYEAINSKGEKGFAVNSIGKQNKNLKSFLNWCFKNEYCPMFDLSHIIKHEEEVDNVYLTNTELSLLTKLKIEDKYKDEMRNLFLFGCETGLRFSDLRRIKPQHINGNYINMFQYKTKERVSPPINSICRAILIKYDNQLPNYKESDLTEFNKQIRDLCKKAGISDNVVIQKEVKGKMIEVFHKKHELVTSHTCRRSFCTNRFLMKTVPLLVIMAISGHKSEKTFMKYLKLSPEELIKVYEEQLIA